MKQNTDVQIVILGGGQGARFWPVSRRARPKQFLSVSCNGETLIGATARRVFPMSGAERLWVVTTELHAPLVQEVLPNAKLLCEPRPRNTAAAIGLAAAHIAKSNPSALMVILPADHAVESEAGLLKTLSAAIDLAAAEDLLVTIGVPPTEPNTAYGYMRRGAKLRERAYMVRRFFEKPNVQRAEKYCESGDFYWNSGMFVWRASVILAAIEEFMPALYEALQKITKAIGTPNERSVLKTQFDELEPVSIDFGVLELARNCALVEADAFGWNDVGSWDAWALHFDHDDQGNLLQGDALVVDSSHCIVKSQDRFIAVVGASNLVVIDSGDALLVCPREKVQEVRKIVEKLSSLGREELV